MVFGDDFTNDLPDDFFQDGTRHDRLNGIVEVFKIIRRNDAPADGESEIMPARATVGMPQYDRALIGYYAIEPVGSPNAGGFRAVYSMQGILDCLCEDMTIEEAMEYFEYNIASQISNRQEAEDFFENKPIKPLIISVFTEDN